MTLFDIEDTGEDFDGRGRLNIVNRKGEVVDFVDYSNRFADERSVAMVDARDKLFAEEQEYIKEQRARRERDPDYDAAVQRAFQAGEEIPNPFEF